jgi:hypothetical protein
MAQKCRFFAGWRGFGRGLLPSLASAVPFSGTNMATFMAGKQLYQDWAEAAVVASGQPGGTVGAPPVRKACLFAPFYPKKHPFTKTGSGQT